MEETGNDEKSAVILREFPTLEKLVKSTQTLAETICTLSGPGVCSAYN
jgi:hypothetical protein